MPIDPSIALGGRPFQLPDPMNKLAQVLQIQAAQQDMGLKTMQADELRRKVSETSALNDAWRQAIKPDGTYDTNKLFSVAAERGLGSHIPAIRKTLTEADTAQANLEKARGETADKAISRYRDQLSFVTTPQQAVQWIRAQHSDPVVGQIVSRMGTVEQAVASIPTDPAGFDAWRKQNALGMTKFVELNKPQLQKLDSGQVESVVAIPGLGGAPQTVTSVQKVMTPGEVASNNLGYSRLTEERRHHGVTEAQGAQTVANQQGQKTQQGVIELRKEFNNLQEVKNYKEVLPIIESAARAPNTPAGDIDLIYAVGKTMDPASVVREGEMNLVIKSGSPAQRLQGYVSYVQGGGRLTSAQRQELMAVMNSRVQGLKSNYDNARKTYETAADRQGLPKDQIFIENPMPAQVVDFGSMPGGGSKGGAKVVNFGDLK